MNRYLILNSKTVVEPDPLVSTRPFLLVRGWGLGTRLRTLNKIKWRVW